MFDDKKAGNMPAFLLKNNNKYLKISKRLYWCEYDTICTVFYAGRNTL